MRYRSRRSMQEALRSRLRDLAATHVRYGYRRLTVLLRREGWAVNAKRIYRLYDEENLKVRSVERKKIGRRQRVSQPAATAPNQSWAADFVSDKLTDGRSYRILTIIDQFTRECIDLMADRSLSGTHVVAALTQAIEARGVVPRSITLDNVLTAEHQEEVRKRISLRSLGNARMSVEPSGFHEQGCRYSTIATQDPSAHAVVFAVLKTRS
jgi:putative transposase